MGLEGGQKSRDRREQKRCLLEMGCNAHRLEEKKPCKTPHKYQKTRAEDENLSSSF